MSAPNPPPAAVHGSLDIRHMAPARRHRVALTVCPLADGSLLSVPTLVAMGSTPGPRLVCVAGIHGDEYDAIAALYELWSEIEPEDLHGVLVMVPCANPPAFRAQTRPTPDDGLDLNRAFPGLPGGTLTQQLAYHILHGLVSGADFLLSMHGWTADGDIVPHVEYPLQAPVTAPSLDAARAFGLQYVVPLRWTEGLLAAQAAASGIPAIEVEIGGLACTTAENRALYKRGVHNLLRHLGMEPGQPELSGGAQRVSREKLRAPVGGRLCQHHPLGAALRAGQSIATISDLFGETLARLDAPCDGILAQQRLRGAVNPGDLAAMLFCPEDE